MPPNRFPRILAVDDQPDRLRPDIVLGLKGKATPKVLHPRDVQKSDLEDADLILVDFVLDNWKERDGAGLALAPSNGLALAVVLREQTDRSATGRLTAFALHTAHLAEVRGRLPPSTAEHSIARLNNLEWAFSKTDDGRWKRMLSLAAAVQAMPRDWPPVDPSASAAEALRLLALPAETSWSDRASREVLSSQPPIHELSNGAHGLLFLRWLLHQVIPYPTFLIAGHWVAARLRISPSSLSKILADKDQLSKELWALSYQGILADFLGPRWWRGGLEDYVWQITEGRSTDVGVLHAELSQRTKIALEFLSPTSGIVCLGADLLATDDIVAPGDAVRLKPDQWPAFADEAWARTVTARSDRFLSTIVDPLDRDRLAISKGQSK